MMLRPVLLLAAIPVLGAVAFGVARDHARRSAEDRADLLRRSILGLLVGAALAIGSWYFLPTNPESPAMLITYVVSWVLGGGTIFFSVPSLLGAAIAKPGEGRGVK